MKNEVKIYIKMIDGVETFIPVIAEKTSDKRYKILSNNDLDLENDFTSIYEFFPGDIVECIYYNNDLNKILIAEKLISSDFPDRNLYAFIYLLVKKQGNIEEKELANFENELKILCSNKEIPQRKHPIIGKWLDSKCK